MKVSHQTEPSPYAPVLALIREIRRTRHWPVTSHYCFILHLHERILKARDHLHSLLENTEARQNRW